MKKTLTLIMIVIIPFVSFSQEITQTIRGVIVDKQSQMTLPGVSIVLLNSNPLKGAATDIDGKFKLIEIPIGRIGLQVTFVGYKPIVLNNLVLSSAKELVLNLELEESVNSLDEFRVIANDDKKKALNEMATVSSRVFTVEETSRYAGSLGDPSRMAANYAGVSAIGDDRNDIIIRGNSPLGLLWRLDGINIPNPNHFGSMGSTGGPVSILNNNLLANSDFMTGAFPAQYGNAIGGAFDLNMRTGNNEKREFIGQVGFNGFELGAEGPMAKKGSYLVSYRYSTLDLMNKVVDLNFGGIPQYQDVSFKIDIPTGLKYGRFTLFGIGGLSYIELLDSKKDSTDKTYFENPSDLYYGSDMGVIGLSHLYFFNETLRGKLSLAVSGTRNEIRIDSLFNNDQDKVLSYGNKSHELKYSAIYNITKKFNAKNTLNIGVIADKMNYHYADSMYDVNDKYRILTNFDGSANLLQNHVQWQHRFTDLLTLNTGFHYQYFTFNNTSAVEPRAGIKWNFSEKQTISFAAGMHSQLQPMSIYFLETNNGYGSIERTNQELEMTKSNHYVLAYDYSFNDNLRFKFETYYQDLYDVPVEKEASTFSTSNIGADYGVPNVDSLENSGSGKNYGIEITLEKFFTNNYYFLLTGSFYESKYTTIDGIERNTAFNGNYTLNGLFGAEFNLDKNKKNVLTISAKGTAAGGKRYIPIDLDKSGVAGQAVYDYDNAYKNKYADYFRSDLKIGYKRNGKKTTQEWAVDIQNITNRNNIFQVVYDQKENKLKKEYQQGIFPMVTYRILF
ncbi:MAG: TonB-dependent receptor [Flavobacteriales bacterium]|nr:TonB-dependent receptor [Flavobacteriales bacterium]